MITTRAIQGLVAVTAGLVAGVVVAGPAAVTNDAQPASTAPKAAVPVPISRSDPAAPVLIQSRRDKISYAFGADLARDLKRQTAEIDPDIVVRALTDSLAGKKLVMTDDEVAATLNQFAADQKKDYEHARTMIAEKNRKAAEAFVAENVRKEGVVTLPDGLQYKILKKGTGKTPASDDLVTCNYRGTLLDGTEIDNSSKRKESTVVPVKGVIPGLSQALQMMPVGSKWQIFIPPPLAYGDRIVAGIGPNAMLIFEVELVSIKEKTRMSDRAQSSAQPSKEAELADNHKP